MNKTNKKSNLTSDNIYIMEKRGNISKVFSSFVFTPKVSINHNINNSYMFQSDLIFYIITDILCWIVESRCSIARLNGKLLSIVLYWFVRIYIKYYHG